MGNLPCILLTQIITPMQARNPVEVTFAYKNQLMQVS